MEKVGTIQFPSPNKQDWLLLTLGFDSRLTDATSYDVEALQTKPLWLDSVKFFFCQQQVNANQI